MNVATWVPITVSCLAFGLSVYTLWQANVRRKANVTITIGKLNDDAEACAGPEDFYGYRVREPRVSDPIAGDEDQPHGGWLPRVRYPIPADVTVTNSGQGDAWDITVTVPQAGSDDRELSNDSWPTLFKFEGTLRPNAKTSLLLGLPRREFRYRVTWQEDAGERRTKSKTFKCDWPEQDWPR